jgi:parvulin-like peptidyl-prolyl isomerase
VGIMPSAMTKRCHFLIGLLAAALFLAGCGRSAEPTASFTPLPPSTIPPTPSLTPEPLAALVNGEPILLVDFEDELTRFETAQTTSGIDLATLGDYQSQVLQALIDRRLLAQGARAIGVEVDDPAVDQRLEQLASDLGGNEEMGTWLAVNGYTLESFKAALAEEMLAANMIEHIVAQVGDSTEQVHAQHILVATREMAESLREQLIDGADFAEIARMYSIDTSSRPAGGDLGWFPMGYLLVPEVEAVAFDLQPGELSEVIESDLGFHIVQTIERGEQPLAPDALRLLREAAVMEWLVAQREMTEVQILIAP